MNPLVTTTDGRVVCLDGKMIVDDNALFRQKDLAAQRDVAEEEPTEVRAREAGLSYVKLDGNIGCLVNGAGLAMATMDIVKLHGGEPANFLDVGGCATAEQVTTAFQIILEDPAVKGILVNIFGGIMRCDVIAEGVVAATKAVGLDRPLVVRLRGNERGRGAADPRPTAGSTSRPPPTWATPRSASWRRSREHLRRQGHAAHHPGHHRRAPASSTRSQCRDYGTNVVGGVTPGRGGERRRGHSRLRHRSRGGRGDRRQHHR